MSMVHQNLYIALVYKLNLFTNQLISYLEPVHLDVVPLSQHRLTVSCNVFFPIHLKYVNRHIYLY